MCCYEEWDITCLASCVDKSTQGKLFVTLRFSFCLDKTDSNSYLHNDWVRDIAFSHPLPWSHLRGVGPLGKGLSLVARCLRPGERQMRLSEQNCGSQPPWQRWRAAPTPTGPLHVLETSQWYPRPGTGPWSRGMAGPGHCLLAEEGVLENMQGLDAWVQDAHSWKEKWNVFALQWIREKFK